MAAAPSSLGYAAALTYREDVGGALGAPETTDPAPELRAKVRHLLALLAAAKSVVAFTGAGISTSAGVPDFRGPAGVWTLQAKGKPLPTLATPFSLARPTLTHQALLALVRSGLVTRIVSQNVDGLHRRSGVPRSALSELHGSCFVEACARASCAAETVRDFEVGTVGFRGTGRRCGACGARTRDWCLDWENPLPRADLAAAEAAADGAGVALCLGTSLQIVPASALPLRTVKAGGALAIVNLQPTPRDGAATIVARGRCDDVMAAVVAGLGVTVPVFQRTDALLLRLRVTPGPRKQSMVLTLRAASTAGDGCPVPMVSGMEVALGAPPGWEGDGGGDASDPDAPDGAATKFPFVVRLTLAPGAVRASGTVILRLCDAADPGARRVVRGFDMPATPGAATDHVVEFVSQIVDHGPAAAEAAARFWSAEEGGEGEAGAAAGGASAARRAKRIKT